MKPEFRWFLLVHVELSPLRWLELLQIDSGVVRLLMVSVGFTSSPRVVQLIVVHVRLHLGM